MPKQFKRTDRIATELQRALAEMIRSEFENVSESLITITHVKVTKDLSYADINVSIFAAPMGLAKDPLLYNETDKAQETFEQLKSHAKHFRKELAQVLGLRVMPELRFHLDTSITDANRLLRLIDDPER